jgi:asparagine synthase (glutamine-hydrolysing)
MCGIAGVVTDSAQVDLELLLRSFTESMTHRGPDDRGVYTAELPGHRIGLAHTRLSILDLSPAGHQPMGDPSGTAWITFNGEIYNFQELRADLQSKGYIFRSGTDTELILAAYVHYGTRAVSLLRGMFAFALWDAEKRILLLARDGFGMKPLYIHSGARTLLFASEIRTLLNTGLVPRKVSAEGVTSYLATGAVGADDTIVQGIQAVAPGTWVTVDLSGGRPKIDVTEFEVIEELASKPLDGDVWQARETVFEALCDSVQRHVIADVPVGLCLSGGIDSVSLAALLICVGFARIRTFTVTFDEVAYSEGDLAERAAVLFGTDHTQVRVKGSEVLAFLPHAIESMDQPSNDGINSYVISRAISQAGVKVALSGLGGDEVFAGYQSFKRAWRLRGLHRVPEGARRMVAGLGRQMLPEGTWTDKMCSLLALGGDPRSVQRICRQLFSPREIGELTGAGGSALPVSVPFGREKNGVHDPITAVSLAEMRGYMANTLLRDVDCMSMAHSLEMRVPYVDREVVRRVLSIAPPFRFSPREHKMLQIRSLRGMLPEFIVDRPKSGFTFPFSRWMSSDLRQEMDGLFSDERCLSRVGLDPRKARQIWLRFLSERSGRFWYRPWSLYVLARWAEQAGVAV